MKLSKGITGVLALAATAVFASALSAQTLQVLTAGSSAQFGPFAEAAWSLATSGGVTAYHYTVKSGACPTSTQNTSCYAYLNDSRSTSIAPEPGNLWVVWNSTQIWAYLSVDSTVGVRAFQAVPRATLVLNLPATPQSAYNTYFDGNADTALPSTVSAALNGAALTAANTDIRPEDALFATNRTLNTLEYATSSGSLIGNAIQSTFGTSPAVAHPVSFALSGGTDPISSKTVPTIYTLPIGAAPVVFLANTTNLSGATNISSAHAASLFSGTGNCAGNLLDGISSSVALSPVLREPLSGTMNTVEYSVFVPGGSSQETGVNDAYHAPTYSNINPLKLPCGSGYRYRGVGTGDEVKAVQGTATGYTGTTNTVGYAFYSVESVAPSSSYKYITLDGVDPINSSYVAGVLPTCATVSGVYDCPVAGGSSFPNLRNGSYKAWSVYRLITDSTGLTNAQALVSASQAPVDTKIPDYVPFNPVCLSSLATGTADEPGLAVYREHYVPSGISTTDNDGPLPSNVSCKRTSGKYTLYSYTLGGYDSTGANNEAGGDVGGTIVGPFNSTTGQPTVPGYVQTSTH